MWKLSMKTAQIKMFESIAILAIFFILILFGFVFYTRVQQSTYKVESEERTILKAIDISQKVLFFPELQCSGDAIIESDCIDLLKLEAAKSIINDNPGDYFNILGFSNIHVTEIYPKEINYSLYNFQKEVNNGQTSTQFPISLFDARTKDYYFGILYVDIYR